MALTLSSTVAGVGWGFDIGNWQWRRVTEAAPWARRAGLQVVAHWNVLFLMGGRTPIASPIPGASIIWDDVWLSWDQGSSWRPIVKAGRQGMWPARAYFQAVTKWWWTTSSSALAGSACRPRRSIRRPTRWTCG